ncbi:RDD family protein [Cytobacillus sp. Hm23]
MRRAIAYIIDIVIISFLLFIEIQILDSILRQYGTYTAPNLIILIAISITTLFITFLFKDLKGASVGKELLGLRIVSLNGEKPTMKALVIRNLILYFTTTIEFFVWVFRKDHRRLGDLLANTKVTRAD